MKYLLKTRVFCRWMRKTELDDQILLNAVDEMERGLIDADLGGGVYKNVQPFQAEENVVVPGLLSQQTGKIGGYFSLVLKRMSEATSHKKNYVLGK